ncbi:hypothetical protein [Psychrobacter urativorans]|uniref:Uncharacterized protein n=1 Tax=Psychrobacter urativorans TaxID=45610 RepID=A0A0M3V8V3_9GAMM|nr:hypothetical protein [Psychrobacter urativorans]ALF59833.1 hypothetical protein AOC03_07095 [Psychrobacter urativorans]
MKNRTLSLSLLIAAAFAIPSVAMAAPAKPKPVTAKTVAAKAVAADNTIQTDIENNDGKLASTQLSAVEISETKKVSRSRVNNNLGQQPMTTEIKAPAEALQDKELQTTEIISEDPVLDAPEDLAEVSEEDL